jgi:hypothetical protein
VPKISLSEEIPRLDERDQETSVRADALPWGAKQPPSCRGVGDKHPKIANMLVVWQVERYIVAFHSNGPHN